MTKKKGDIIVISPANFPGKAGDSANYLELVNSLNRKGLKVVLICPISNNQKNFDKRLRKKGIRVVRIPVPLPRMKTISQRGLNISVLGRLLFFYILSFLTILIVILRHNTKLCMIRHSVPTVHLAPLLRMLRVRSVADGEILSISQEWKHFLSPWMRHLFSQIERWDLYTFFKVTGESQFNALIKFGYPKGRVIKTKIGVDISSIPVHDIMGIRDHTFGYFGNLEIWQGLDFLLRCFAEAIKKNNLVKLFIIGDGTQRDQLESLSKELGLEKNVEFTGSVQRELLWERYFKMFRVMVIPRPRLEGVVHQPIKLAEALAAGKPVIATSVKGLKEFEGKGVLLVTPGNVEQMINAILLLSSNEKLLLSLSEDAIESSKVFDIDAQVDKIMRYLFSSKDS